MKKNPANSYQNVSFATKTPPPAITAKRTKRARDKFAILASVVAENARLILLKWAIIAVGTAVLKPLITPKITLVSVAVNLSILLPFPTSRKRGLDSGFELVVLRAKNDSSKLSTLKSVVNLRACLKIGLGS